jgi:endonuclease/exonuclease/phosphatase family metal-dependent hydrolase
VIVGIVIGALLVVGGYYLWYYQLRPRHPVGPTVRIATWNLRQFSESRRGLDVRTIARIIRDSNFDIVAIQEVKKEGAAVDRLLNELGVPWRASSFSDLTGNHERFVFIYNGDHVSEIGTAHFIATADAVIFDRVPYQQTFRAGNFDFTLVTCHLYYGEGAEGYARRRREAHALATFAQNLAARSAEKDVIVLGDFNETRGHTNFDVFASVGMESLNREPSNLGSTEVYDSLIIEPKFTHEWNGVASAVRFDEINFGNDDKTALEKVSDHRPVYADFVTNLPDDD